jgi:hypothetical protein
MLEIELIAQSAKASGRENVHSEKWPINQRRSAIAPVKKILAK